MMESSVIPDSKEGEQGGLEYSPVRNSLVSVTIPTFNSGKTLAECLRSIADQSYQDLEIIVADSDSRDETLDIARQYKTRICFADSLSGARLEGISKSRGTYILLLDSDQILEKDVISRCVNLCEKEGFEAVTLFERSIITKNSFLERTLAYDKWLIHFNQDDDVTYGSAIPRFFKANLLKNVRIPPTLLTFDHNVLYAAATSGFVRVGFLDALIYHHEPSSWTEIARKFFRYGQFYFLGFKANRRLVTFHSLPRRAYFTKTAMRTPQLLAGLAFLYCLKALASFCGATTVLLDKLAKARDRKGNS
jgi:glycosyltransferase involved in cell wall biosynthesis